MDKFLKRLLICSKPVCDVGKKRKNPYRPYSFRIGDFLLGDNAQNVSSTQIKTILLDCISNKKLVNRAYHNYKSVQGLGIYVSAISSVHSADFYLASHDLNQCSVLKDSQTKEVIFHLSLASWPWNEYSVKNLAFNYEWQGYLGATNSLYQETILLSRDPGCLLQSVFLSPPLLWDENHGAIVFLQIITRARRLLEDEMATYRPYDPMLAVRELQLNPQYIGVGAGIIYELYSRILLRIFPELAATAIPFRSPGDAVVEKAASVSPHLQRGNLLPPPPQTKDRRRIRLGIVSEHSSNSSPGLCIYSVLRELVGYSLGQAAPLPLIDLVYFDRHEPSTATAEEMRRASASVVFMDFNNLQDTQHLIAAQRLDCLLYLALPTEKFTLLLSQARLAPVQIQYGIGHPLSSGVASMDYTVVTSAMLPSPRTLTASTVVSASTCLDALSRLCPHSHHSPESCQGVPEECAGNSYVEQLVLFDSLGYYLDDPLGLYGEPPFELEQIRGHPYCDTVDSILSLLRDQHAPIGSLEKLLCSEAERLGTIPAVPRHLYICMQIPKKMQPKFDRVLGGILSTDPHAILILDQRAQVLQPRWQRTIATNITAFLQRTVFVPRIPHREYIRLLSVSSVFLNPFPFGSGITSSEAIALCVPVVTLSEEIRVLHFALAQIRSLGSDVEALMVTHSVEAYISRAVAIASGSLSPLMSLRQLLCERRPLLFGRRVLDDTVLEWYTFLSKVIS